MKDSTEPSGGTNGVSNIEVSTLKQLY